VTLSDGRELIDFGSYAVPLLGHRHPQVVEAVERQLRALPASTRALGNATTATFISELVARSADAQDRVWIGSDGADAVEVAVKAARRGSGRLRVLAVEGAFHGKTLGALSLTAEPSFRAGLDGVLGQVSHLATDDPGAVRRETERGDVAALVFEPIQGEAGVRPLDIGVLRRWADDARAAGAFVISDEVQVGLRRCGPFSVASEWGLEPDALLLGKALGGGVMPLAAMVATEELQRPLYKDPTWHSATFGGHPLSCAAGTAALRAIDDLAGAGLELATALERGLGELAAAHGEVVSEVRGAGLLWGLELGTPDLAGTTLIELAERGLLVSPCLSSTRTIRLAPPLVTTPAQLEAALAILEAALEAAPEGQ
jgi:putrescine aminotransferase